MKKVKSLKALVLSLMLCLAMGTTAFASEVSTQGQAAPNANKAVEVSDCGDLDVVPAYDDAVDCMLHFIAIWHKVQHTIIRKLDYIAAGGIINMVNMVNTAVNNNIYAGRKSGSKYNQSKDFQQKEVLEIPNVAAVNKYANVQEIYEALKCNVLCRGYEQGQDEIAEKEIQNDEPEISNDSSEKMTAWYQGVPLKEWALTDPKYTDSETGISWYIRDGKYPYMVGEDAEKFRKLCEESGEFPLKKFGEMTGLIQKLDDNTVAYVGDNGIAVKSKDGKEMFVDTSGLSYDILMDMFRNLPRNGNFFSNKYWSDNIQKAQARS